MKKRSRIIALVTTLCICLSMFTIGVLAVTSVTLNVTSSVSFESNGAYVKVKGEVQKGNADTEPVRAVEPEGSDYYYIGYSYDAVDEEQETDTQVSDYNDTPVGTSSVPNMTSWTIGNVEFSENESIIRYSLTFTNYSEKPVQATITTNKDVFLSDPEIQGKVNINETSKSVIIDGYDGAMPKTATYTITLTLTNFSTSFTNKGLTIDVNFSTEIKEPEPEELVPGLSISISDENKKEATITGYTGNATNIVIPESFNFAEKEMPNSFILESEDDTPPMAFMAMLYLGDFNIILGNGTKIEGINFLEMQGLTLEETYSITFEQTYTLKIENNELDMQMLAALPMMVTKMPAEFGVTVELPKVKENGLAEWREFQDVEEFSTYVSSIMEAPETASFPLEFEFEPPKYMVAVEGNDYTITSIGNSAFEDCSSLTSVTIPSSVTSIGESAFSNCSTLQITVEEGNANYSSYNGSLYTKDQTTLIRGAGISAVNILDSVKSIESSAFNDCSNLTTVTFGNNSALESIGSYAFSNCSSLTSVTIPSSVTTIGEFAFFRCSSLATVTFGDNSALTSIDGVFSGCSNLTTIIFGDNSALTSIGGQAFHSCRNLTTIIFGDNSALTSIGGQAFHSCSSLTTVTFGDNSALTSIGDQAFHSCRNLTSITIPEKVTSIGGQAFYGCYALAEVYNFSNLNITAGFSSYGGVAEHAKVIHTSKDEPTRIKREDGVQYYEYGGEIIVLAPMNRNISSATLKEGTTEINHYAFVGCSSLTSVPIPSRVTSIGSYAFSGCSSLESITIPSSVTSIGSHAFYECSGLTSITFGENSKLASISDSAFYSTGLTSIEIPSSVTNIDSNAFMSCGGLTSITFGENSKLASIDNYAFSSCTSLTSIEIPSSVTSIGSNAFQYCSGLKYIHLLGDLNGSCYLGGAWQYSATELTTPTFSTTTSYMESAGWYYQKSAWNA